MPLCRRSALALCALLQFAAAQTAAAQATTTAGEFSVEPPTLVALGFDWEITARGTSSRTITWRIGTTASTSRRRAILTARRMKSPIAFRWAIDIYKNDIYNMRDNCVEADGGGRVYFVQNLVYNGPGSGSPKYVATPAGVLCSVKSRSTTRSHLKQRKICHLELHRRRWHRRRR